MDIKKIIFVVVGIVLVVIALSMFTKRKPKPKESIVDTTIEVATITEEDRMKSSIDNAVESLKEAGLTVTKQDRISLENINGYKVQIDDQSVELYYLERAKLANILKSGSIYGEAEIEINGSIENAITCGNMFVLNCKNNEIKEKIISTLSSRK